MKNLIKHLFMLCLFGMISIGANAETKSGPCGDNATWSLDTETWELSITGSGDMKDYYYYASWYDYRSNIKSLSIGDQITSIGNYAFYECSGLTSVTIPNSVTSIGNNAFSNCTGLTSVTIPESVTSIGERAFAWCSGLTSVTIPESVTEIGDDAFYGCTTLPEENNLRYADTYLVEAVDKTLSTYNIKESTKWIGSSAFYECASLTSVTIPESVTSIGSSAFEDCSNLTSVTIPESVISIGSSAFEDCSNLTSVTIPKSVTSIGGGAFAYCSGLTSVTIPNSVTSIGGGAFSGCSGLTSVTIGNSVTSIGNYAFEDCSNLTSVTIPKSVTSIGEYAFANCNKLTSVTIGNSVTSIGYYAFYECLGLTRVNITDLDKWVEINFVSANANPLYIAHNLYLNGELVTNAKLTTAKKIGSYAFSGYPGLKSIEIPNSVTEIGDDAFFGCSGLTSVTIPNSVTEIGYGLFANCSGLKSATIGNSVTSIGHSAFYDCSDLTSVTIGNSVTSIGNYAFNWCSSLRNIIAEGINAPTIEVITSFSSVTDCSLHVPSGSEESYAANFETRFKSGNSYGNTIVAYSAYSKNSDGEYNFETWGSSSDVTLSEGIEKVYVPVEASVKTLQYKRTFNNTDWQALYVPFELDVTTDLADFSVYKISTSSADAINVTLMTDGKTSANTPYLIKAKATGEKAISVSSKTVKVTKENTNLDLSDFEIVGTYEKLNYGDIAGDWYALKDGKFMKAGEGAYLNPYRFYLKRKSSSSKESIEINFNEPTGITLYDNPSHRQAQGKLGSGQAQNENKVIYNLNGMRVDSNYKGIVIINGKKYLKK